MSSDLKLANIDVVNGDLASTEACQGDGAQLVRSSRLYVGFILAGLMALAGALYVNGLRASFLFDDLPVVLHAVESRSVSAAISGQWTRRVGFLSFALNHHFHGPNVAGYRIVNIVIHALCGLALFGLIRRLLRTPGVPTSWTARADGFAAAISALWLAHPLQTESVTYVVQRFESLAALWMLLTLYALVRSASSRTPWPWYALCVLSMFLGIQTKETAVVIPALTLALDRIFLAGSWRELFRRRGFVHGVLAAASLTALAQVTQAVSNTSTVSAGFGIQGLSSWEYLRSQGGVLLHYLRLAVWPDALCFDYKWPIAHSPWEIYPAAAVIVALLTLTCVGLWYWPRMGFLGLAFFALLSPSSSFVPILDLAVEHRMYLPLVAVITFLGVAVVAVGERWVRQPAPRRHALVAVFTVVLAGLGTRTVIRNQDYANPVRLWSKAVQTNGSNSRARMFLGAELVRARQIPQGIAELEKAIELNPTWSTPHINLGTVYRRIGKLEEAAQSYERALQLSPDDAKAAFNYGNLCASRQRTDEAIQWYRKAVTNDPRYVSAWVSLGIVLESRGEDLDAADAYRKALALVPETRNAALRLADLLATSRDPRVRSPSEALRICDSLYRSSQGRDRQVLDTMAAAYAAANQFGEAVKMAEQAMVGAKDAGMRRRIESRLIRYRRGEAAERELTTEPAREASVGPPPAYE